MRYFYLAAAVFVFITGAVAFPLNLQHLSDEERISIEFKLLFGDADRENLFPCEENFLKSGTPLLLDILKHKELLTVEQRKVLRNKLTRPSLPDYYDTPDGHFKIHYNASISDTHYVHRCGEFFMRAWAVEVDSFGFNPPISDGTLGGDDRFDVYIMSLGTGVYGITYPDGNEGPNPWHDESAFIEVNTSYEGFPPNDDPEGSSWGAFKVTCAHEFFHGIQMGYDPDEDVWMLEIASVWMEDMVFDYVNDYYNYLSGYSQYLFDAPYLSLMEYSMHMYSSCVWFRYLSENYGVDVIKEIFDNMIYRDGMNAISAALDSMEKDVGDEFLNFSCWNYLTSSRADDYHYEEAENYPDISVEASVSSYPHTFYPVSSHRPHSFGANYINLTTTPEYGIYIDIDGASGADWKIAVVIPGDSSEIIYPDDFGYVNTRGLPACVVVAPIGSFTSSSTTYDFSLTIRECSDVYEEPQKPHKTYLLAYPNPFNCEVEILGLKDEIFEIRNLAGRTVFKNSFDENGKIIWHPQNVPAGIYIGRSKNNAESLKLIYVP